MPQGCQAPTSETPISERPPCLQHAHPRRIVTSTPVPDGRRVQVGKLQQLVAAPPITALPQPERPHQQSTPRIRASAHRPDAQPPICRVAAARAAATRRPRTSPALTTALVAPRSKTFVARRRGRRGCEQPRCARGNLKAVAEGDNEDDVGAVRSEGSGPQSWALASPASAASGGLRSTWSQQHTRNLRSTRKLRSAQDRQRSAPTTNEYTAPKEKRPRTSKAFPNQLSSTRSASSPRSAPPAAPGRNPRSSSAPGQDAYAAYARRTSRNPAPRPSAGASAPGSGRRRRPPKSCC